MYNNAFLNTVYNTIKKDTSTLFFHVNQLEFYKCNDKTLLANSAFFSVCF